MRFFVRELRAGRDVELMLQTNDLAVLCHLQAKRDTVNAWLCGLSELKRCDADTYRTLIENAPYLQHVDYDRLTPRQRTTFYQFSHALYMLVRRENTRDCPACPDASATIGKLLDSFCQIRVERKDSVVRYGTVVEGCAIPKNPIEYTFAGDHFDGIPQRRWLDALWNHCDPDTLKQLLDRFDYLALSTQRNNDPLQQRSFLTLCQALVKIIEENDSLDAYSQLIPMICEAIVLNQYGGIEEQKPYLERILADDNRERTTRRLFRIIDTVNWQTQQRLPQQPGHLENLVGLMADHYLRNYDLDQAVALWEKTGRARLWRRPANQAPAGPPDRPDRFLWLILRLYSHPMRAFGLVALVLGLMTVLTYVNIQPYQLALTLKPYIFWIGLLMVGLLMCIVLFMIIYMFLRIIWQKDFYYSQLLLPRLWGAIIVGLAVLLQNDYPWKIGLQSSLVNLLLLGIPIYLLSFIYIFVDVYQAMKYHSTFEHIVQTSGKVFVVGLLESFLAVLITSTLVFPITGISAENNPLGSIVCLNTGSACPLEYGFFPTLVLLWTGLALFIGAFAQLLWQGRRITESV